jgi:hypothetical protein
MLAPCADMPTCVNAEAHTCAPCGGMAWHGMPQTCPTDVHTCRTKKHGLRCTRMYTHALACTPACLPPCPPTHAALCVTHSPLSLYTMDTARQGASVLASEGTITIGRPRPWATILDMSSSFPPGGGGVRGRGVWGGGMHLPRVCPVGFGAPKCGAWCQWSPSGTCHFLQV